MTTWAHRSMIVPTAFAPLARGLCEGLAGPGGSGMFATGLSADGTLPATHYISAGVIESDFAALLPLDGAGGQAETVVAAAQGMVTLEQIAALFAAVDVSEQLPHDALARIGLQLCVAPEI